MTDGGGISRGALYREREKERKGKGGVFGTAKNEACYGQQLGQR